MEEKPRGMTADELQAVVRRLANVYHCRYWIRYSTADPWLMAIQCRNNAGLNVMLPFLEREGFRLDIPADDPHQFLYVIPRLDENGQPFTSPMF